MLCSPLTFPLKTMLWRTGNRPRTGEPPQSRPLSSVGNTIDSFPKVRPTLPDDYAAIYTAHYKENRGGKTPASSLSQKLEQWLHRQVAADVMADQSPRTTLEIGAGTLNHLAHEPDTGPYDIVEPFMDLYTDSPSLPRIRNVYADVREIPLSERYDRITSIATFEHVCNLPDVVATAGLLLQPNGTLRVSIPSEGTFLWKLGWALTTGLEFRIRYGLDYGVLMRHEHVNTATEIEGVLSFFFREISTNILGISKQVSLYRYYQCSSPRREECAQYLRKSLDSPP